MKASQSRSVYLFQSASGPIKIGVAHDIHRRLKTLQGGCPYKLRLITSYELPPELAFDVEGMAHDILAKFRLEGEWFDISIEDGVEAVKTAIAQATGQDNTRTFLEPLTQATRRQKAIRKAQKASAISPKRPGPKQQLTPYEMQCAEKDWKTSQLTQSDMAQKYGVAPNYFWRYFGARGYSPEQKRPPRPTKPPVQKRKYRRPTITREQWAFMLITVAQNPMISSNALSKHPAMPRRDKAPYTPKRTTLNNYMPLLRDGEPYPFDD